jgi:hypothetical protein
VRSPCRQCEVTGIALAIEAAEEISMAQEAVVGMGPTDYERTAARRWREADAELQALEQPLADAEGDTVLNAQRRLHALFVELWSLRESAIRDGVKESSVDNAISQSPHVLALAHDRGNLAKHGAPRGVLWMYDAGVVLANVQLPVSTVVAAGRSPRIPVGDAESESPFHI